MLPDNCVCSNSKCSAEDLYRSLALGSGPAEPPAGVVGPGCPGQGGGSCSALDMLSSCALGGRPSELPAWVVVSAAGLGGLMYWVAIFPVDQVKSAMQTDAIDPAQRRFPTMAVATQVLPRPCCPRPLRLQLVSAQVACMELCG